MNKYKMVFQIIAIFVYFTTGISQVGRIDFQKQQEIARGDRATQQILQERAVLDKRIQERKALYKNMQDMDALEGWIDPKTYLIGAGDILGINIIGAESKYMEVIVSPEGKLNIPGVMTISVAEMTLNQVKNVIKERLSNFFKDTSIYVSLASVRLMKMFVLGEVYSPGACIAKPTDRLFDVLSRSGGVKRLAKLNSIEIYRDSDTLFIRGNEYFINGDLNQNPYIIDGDVIFVPKAVPYEQTVTVQGGVLEPGLYPISCVENLSQFLSQYVDYTEDVQLCSVTVTRFINNQKKTMVIDLNASDAVQQLQGFILESGDIIEIGILSQVYVQGEVSLPGAYPYVASFKAVDFVGLAGGATTKGKAKTAIVIHPDGSKSKGLMADIYRGDVIIVPRSLYSIFVGEVGLLQITLAVIQTLLTIAVLQAKT
ncbi:MAG: polysaccharide biosynthesis/export family protein [Candidatus Marinimicrobia bacterium]|nr:polysaccharide biosynthesis/export family protein [Candidatus Neomarinimicrobiota bacterium]